MAELWRGGEAQDEREKWGVSQPIEGWSEGPFLAAGHKAGADPGDTRRGNQEQTAWNKLVAESVGKSLGSGRAEDLRGPGAR